MESIETSRQPGRPKKLNRPLSRTIYVEADEYEEMSAEAKSQKMSFFEFIDLLYHAYIDDKNKETIGRLKELKETKEELDKVKKENADLSEKLTRIYASAKKSAAADIDKDTMISEAIDKMDEIRPRFEADIKMSQSGELALMQNREILKNRRELFRERKAEYVRIKGKLAGAGIHDIDSRISEFEAIVWNAQKALGISGDKDDKNTLIYAYDEENSPFWNDRHESLKPELNTLQASGDPKTGVKVRS